MPWVIPQQQIHSFKSGDGGIVVWGLQKGLGTLGYDIPADGAFGPQTEYAVKEFQRKNNLYQDGIFGPASSRQMAVRLNKRPDRPEGVVLPDGLLTGFVEAESAGAIGAVNWSVAGGVDCSYFQRRVYDNQLNDDDAIQRAFDPAYQRDLLANRLRDRHDVFIQSPHVNGNHQLAWKLASLNHNYPYAAHRIADVGFDGLSSYWRTPQDWVKNIGAKFEDGQPVTTPLEWCRFYALGAPPHNHLGKVVKYVKEWPA